MSDRSDFATVTHEHVPPRSLMGLLGTVKAQDARIKELTMALQDVVNETTKGSPVSAFAAVTRSKQVLASSTIREDSDHE